jgi:transposase
VGADLDPQPVHRFPTFTRDLHALADWPQQCGVRSVAMESTSVYWIPIYQILGARGLEVCLVNAQHVKNVPGAQDGRVRLPVASVPALCRFAASEFPATERDLRCSRSLASSRQLGPNGC